MACTIEVFEEIKKRELKMDDTFQFECKMCGRCCRKRSEPILLTGADLFRIACSLQISLGKATEKYTEWYIGKDSHVPILVLKERLDGSCRLLKNGKCSVQDSKPAVCALYPLGRFWGLEDEKFHYFWNFAPCQNDNSGKKAWTLQEWLDNFEIEENEEMTAAWHRLLGEISALTSKMIEQNIKGDFLRVLFGFLYLHYDTYKPFIEQVNVHRQMWRVYAEHRGWVK